MLFSGSGHLEAEGKSNIFLSCHHFFLLTYTILQSNTDVMAVLGVSGKPPKFLLSPLSASAFLKISKYCQDFYNLRLNILSQYHSTRANMDPRGP